LVDPNTRQGKRTPVTLKIKFKSETLEQFIERYAVDVSQGGIFIRTKEPLAVGTQMKFEFQLRDASPLIAGEGTVVWTRENDPSRPAIAPGMGVRFDRLADGSQGILERILTEKAKQAPQRPAPDSSKPPLFTDTPTRVAPAPMQDALLGKDNGRRREELSHSDSHTPLPKPMPFHSDADEFPDEAFEEATKVRALDELIAQTAEDDSKLENTSNRRINGRNDATAVDPTNERLDPRPMVLPPQELQEVPDLPNPPEMLRPPPRMLENSPPPRIDSMPAIPEGLGKTRLGVEPARARIGGGPTPPPPLGPMGGSGVGMFGPPPGSPLGDAPILPSGMRSVAAEPTEPARMPPLPSRSLAPLVILICLIVAAGSAAAWFFFLRPQITEPRDRTTGSADSAAAPATPGTAGASGASNGPPGGPAPGPAAGTPAGSGAAPARGEPPASGSAAVATGSAAGSAEVKAELVDTTIAASNQGATVEISGTDKQGPAPFTAKLEKGKSYKARITARGFATLEVDIKGGEPQPVAKLVAKPRHISLSTDPSGAQISIDGTAINHATPFEFELTPAQTARKSLRIVLRKPGFRAIDRTIDASKFTEDDTGMTFKLDEKLTVAPVASRPTGTTRPTGGSAGSDAGSGAGSDAATTGGGQGSQSAGPGTTGGSTDGPVTSPTPPAPPPAGAGSGATAGSAEPEPDFNKK
jgi:uncharacterized protein (TIGR02266 family)